MANDDSYKAIRCPSCGQFISNLVDNCRFCNTFITDDMKAKAIKSELEETRKFSFDSHKKFVYSGLGTLAVGVALLVFSLFTMFSTNEGRFFIWSPILIVLGIAQTMYGSFGMFEERKRKK